MTAGIDDWARMMLARTDVFGTLATISADGAPHQAVVWYLLRGDDIVINSAVGRVWPANLMRDPRCSLVIADAYDWLGVRGHADVVTDQETAQADIAEMARRYHAHDLAKAEALIQGRFQRQQRVTFVIRPERVMEHPDD